MSEKPDAEKTIEEKEAIMFLSTCGEGVPWKRLMGLFARWRDIELLVCEDPHDVFISSYSHGDTQLVGPMPDMQLGQHQGKSLMLKELLELEEGIRTEHGRLE